MFSDRLCVGWDRAGFLKACSCNLGLDQYLGKKEGSALGPGRSKTAPCLRCRAALYASVLKESPLTRTPAGSAVVAKKSRASREYLGGGGGGASRGRALEPTHVIDRT